MQPIVLASSSPYRRQLLEKLQLPFSCFAPDIDEQRFPNEAPAAMALRLAVNKAQAVAANYATHLIIGSDQVACLHRDDGDEILGKPGSHQRAVAQLNACSGQRVDFYTGLVLLNSRSGELQSTVEHFAVYFRILSPETIEHYLAREPAYDCAGSFKVEGLGITLFERLQGRDPNSLTGLPLIALVDMLSHAGIEL
jgi:septum formation protein